MAEDRRKVANRIVVALPQFGTWAAATNEFETPHGRVGYRQLSLLFAMRERMLPGDKVTPSAVASFFQVQPSVVTRIIAKLEASGFVTRIGDPHDGRSFHIEISDRGIEISRYVEEIYNQEVFEELSGLDDDEIAELARAVEILDRIGRNLIDKRRAMIHGHRSKSPLE